jgi:hypothetical protein
MDKREVVGARLVRTGFFGDWVVSAMMVVQEMASWGMFSCLLMRYMYYKSFVHFLRAVIVFVHRPTQLLVWTQYHFSRLISWNELDNYIGCVKLSP